MKPFTLLAKTYARHYMDDYVQHETVQVSTLDEAYEQLETIAERHKTEDRIVLWTIFREPEFYDVVLGNDPKILMNCGRIESKRN